MKKLIVVVLLFLLFGCRSYTVRIIQEGEGAKTANITLRLEGLRIQKPIKITTDTEVSE